jgi:hypothetical protein
MNDLIRKLLKEDFETITDISVLSADVLKAAIRNIVNLAIRQKSALNVFTSIFNIFDKTKSNYSKISDFLRNFKLVVKFSRSLGDDSTLGKFKPYSDDDGLLILKLSPQQIKESLERHVLTKLSGPINEQTIEFMVDNVYKDIITDEMRDTIAHELQHAYDSWRSKRMYVANKTVAKYRADYPDENAPITPQQYKDYLRLPHEINARFTETIKNLKLIVKNSDGSFDMVPFDKLKKEFEIKFEGFNVIKPKMASSLIKRLYTYYLSVREKLLKKGIDKLQQKTLK